MVSAMKLDLNMNVLFVWKSQFSLTVCKEISLCSEKCRDLYVRNMFRICCCMMEEKILFFQ